MTERLSSSGAVREETGTFERLSPGGTFINETFAAVVYPVLSAPTISSITSSTAVLSVTISFE